MRSGQRSARTAAIGLAALMLGGCGSSTVPRRGAPTPTARTPTMAPSATPGSPLAPPAPPDWKPCTGTAGPNGFECASIQVPRDPRNPSLGTVAMALDRRAATGERIGSLLVNPGGPGASGVDFLPTEVGWMPASLRKRFDIVGFDPPGVGRTAPVHCADGAGMDRYFNLDPTPPDTAAIEAELGVVKSFTAGCQELSGNELPYVSTVDAAMDMDLLRQALGDSKLTYLGFSYGTFLGSTYAGLYPDRVRAMVLDGAIDPSLSAIQIQEQQAAAVEGDLHDALAACQADSHCPWKPGPDLVAAYKSLLDSVRVHPLRVKGTARTVGPAPFLLGTAATLYAQETWTILYQALARASAGDGSEVLDLFDSYTHRRADGSYENLFEANAAIGCIDAPAPTVAEVEAAVPQAQAMAPLFGESIVLSQLTCAEWPVPATGTPGPARVAGSPPIVVVGSTGDPATPYRWAQSLASQLSNAVLVTRVGDGHTGYSVSGCVRDSVDAYLVGLTVPPTGLRCPSS